MFNKIAIYLIFTVLLSGGVYAGFKHYTGLHEEIANLETENSQLYTANEQLKNELGNLKLDIAINEVQSEQLQTELQTARGEVNELRDIFASHDLNYLFQEKPGLVLRILQRGTDQFYTEVEETTK